jgi:hypothetical protein
MPEGIGITRYVVRAIRSDRGQWSRHPRWSMTIVPMPAALRARSEGCRQIIAEPRIETECVPSVAISVRGVIECTAPRYRRQSRSRQWISHHSSDLIGRQLRHQERVRRSQHDVGGMVVQFSPQHLVVVHVHDGGGHPSGHALAAHLMQALPSAPTAHQWQHEYVPFTRLHPQPSLPGGHRIIAP